MTDREGGSSRWLEAHVVVDAVLELAPDAREDYIRRACANDPGLEAAVRRWLAGIGEAERDPTVGIGGYPPQGAEVDTTLPSRMGRYRVLRVVGEGGMGTVFEGERDDGTFRQRVAIKLMRPMMAERVEFVQRFRTERQILATLSHPNIASLLDGDVTPEGIPYCVLEFVEGEPLPAWCDARQLDLRARIGLFRQVIDAVRHAHQRLIVHRDLKPANILVDTEGRAKLLDFGVARLLVDPGDSAAVTRPDGMPAALTPEYASPEQLLGQSLGVATDVYSLGVVLSELLTGRRPFADVRGWTALLRTVTTTDPQLCSTQPITAAAAAVRSCTPARLRQALQGDLDRILARAVARDPGERYRSVEELDGDLQRYLTGRPVLASNAGGWYRAAKFVRRNSWGVLAMSGLVASLLAGVVATSWQARTARREATRAKAVNAFLADIFQAADPDQARGTALSAREILDAGRRRIDSTLVGQPEVQAELYATLGRVYLSLGALPDADSMFRRAYIASVDLHGERDVRSIRGLGHWAAVKREAGAYAEAESLLVLVEAAERRLGRSQDSARAYTLNGLGNTRRRLGKPDLAVLALREALKIDLRLYGSDNVEVAGDLSDLAIALGDAGQWVAAESALGAAVALNRRLLPGDHPSRLNGEGAYASILARNGDLDSALALQRRAIADLARVFPEGHPLLALGWGTVGRTELVAGRLAEASEGFSQAEGITIRTLSPTHPLLFDFLTDHASVRLEQGRLAEAKSMIDRALEGYRAHGGPDHPGRVDALGVLARIEASGGAIQRAETQLAEALALGRRVLRAGHPSIGTTLAEIGQLRMQRGDTTAAEGALREAVQILTAGLPWRNPEAARSLVSLATCLKALGQRVEAESLLVVSEARFASQPYRTTDLLVVRRTLAAWRAEAPRPSR